jgi:hypothetical protein
LDQIAVFNAEAQSTQRWAEEILFANLCALRVSALENFASLTARPDGAVEHLVPAPLSSSSFYRVAAP